MSAISKLYELRGINPSKSYLQPYDGLAHFAHFPHWLVGIWHSLLGVFHSALSNCYCNAIQLSDGEHYKNIQH